jgi:hypothetical protein
MRRPDGSWTEARALRCCSEHQHRRRDFLGLIGLRAVAEAEPPPAHLVWLMTPARTLPRLNQAARASQARALERTGVQDG